MRKIFSKRRTGKSTRLLYTSDVTKTPILCANCLRRNVLMKEAKTLNLKIPTPITVEEIINNKYCGFGINNIMIDDAEDVLSVIISQFMRCNIIALTMTEEDD